MSTKPSRIDSLVEIQGFEPIFLVAPLKLKVPSDLFTELCTHIEAECNHPDRKNYDHELAGRIWHGEQLAGAHSLPDKLKLWFCLMGREYTFRIARINGFEINPRMKVSFIDSWIVRSKEGDYNPAHRHSGELAAIIYVKVPPQVADPETMDGKLDFVFGQSKESNIDFLGSRKVIPQAADMYIFPAWLTHIVYPYQGAGERVSYSYNLAVQDIAPNHKSKSEQEATDKIP